MDKPVLVIMAAGMGSRYGGLKQIDPVDDQGQIIMDFSIYDAKRAGFEKVIFIIKKENEKDFRACIGDRLSKYMDISYIFQDINNLPNGFEVPEGRMKPWGTGHAVLSCYHEIHGPFAVINADDYYGREAFRSIYEFLEGRQDERNHEYTMVGYRLKNTLTENGHVSRGICQIDDQSRLVDIQERTQIEKKGHQAFYTEDEGQTWKELPMESIVSMNMWGFTQEFLEELNQRFPKFLEENLKKNPMGCEYFLPSVVGELIQEKIATVNVLTSKDKWYGITYKEDKKVVVEAISCLKEQGYYPNKLWD